MSAHSDPDEQLVAELRELFAQDDPVPEIVLEAGRAAFGWRRFDADLAELLSDSALEGELAGARGVSTVRTLSFRAGETTIDLEIYDDGSERTLLGQLSPPSASRIDVQRPDEPAVAAAWSDNFGRFRAQLSAWGPIRLRVAGRLPDSAMQIETSWIPL
jgi:hypothetical protein